MLEEIEDNQEKTINILINEIKKDKISHAYLFESNSCPNTFDIALAFAKAILCPNHYSNSLKCDNCIQCKQIDNNNFLEIKVIKADGLWIKKSQLIELQEQFSTKSVIGKRKVYIIKDADKLNSVAANSLLKFLEEPEENIVAILISNSRHQLLETIVSRCQIISFNEKNIKGKNKVERLANHMYNTSDEISQFINDETNLDKIEKVIKFVNNYEKEKKETFLYTYDLWTSLFKTKEDFTFGFELLVLFYRDVLLYKCKKQADYFIDNLNDLKEISSNNTIETICYKINKCIDLKEKIKYNANTNLLLDKLIIELGRC